MIWLRQTFPLLNELAYTLIFWVFIDAFMFVFFTWAIPLLTRKTKTEIDDVVIGVLRFPIMIIVAAYGILDYLSTFGKLGSLLGTLQNIYILIVIWALTVLAYKLLRDVLGAYLMEFVEESESNIDDVLLPFITRVGPIAVIIVATLITVWVFSPSLLAEVLTFIGALSFLLIFLFQEPLSNLFSGIYLWIDTPFKYKDLILLEDDIFYRIENIGFRVSKLYNTEAHTVAYYPNNKLAEQRLVNVTKPNVELPQGINIGIAYKHDFDDIVKMQSLLSEIAQKHVHVLGPWDQPGEGLRPKKELIEEEISALRSEGSQNSEEAQRLENEMERLKIEYKMRDDNQRLWEKMTALTAVVCKLETEGLAKKEREYIKSCLDDIKINLLSMRRDLSIWVRWSGMLQAMYKFSGDDFINIEFTDVAGSIPTIDEWLDIHNKDYKPEQYIDHLLTLGKIPLIGEFNRNQEILLSGIHCYRQAYLIDRSMKNYSISDIRKIDLGFEKLNDAYHSRFLRTTDLFDDYEWLLQTWSSATRILMKRFHRIEKMLEKRGACEFQIDTELSNMAKYLSDKFMLKVPGFRYPDPSFRGYGESSVDFRLEFFVDDLVGEHFKRSGDVISEIGIQIKKQFDVNNIEIPFPQRDIWVRSHSNMGTSKDIIP